MFELVKHSPFVNLQSHILDVECDICKYVRSNLKIYLLDTTKGKGYLCSLSYAFCHHHVSNLLFIFSDESNDMKLGSCIFHKSIALDGRHDSCEFDTQNITHPKGYFSDRTIFRSFLSKLSFFPR